MCRALVAVILFGCLFVAPVASAAPQAIEFSLSPDPPVAGRPFTVLAAFASDASGVSNVTLKACAYDRAAKAATVCLLPSEMSRIGASNFTGSTDPRASGIFEAGGSVGINISYVDATGAHRDFPGDGREYVLFDIVADTESARSVPGPGWLSMIAGFVAAALVWGRRA